MKPSLQPGVSRVKRFTVNRGRTISFMGDVALAIARLEAKATRVAK